MSRKLMRIARHLAWQSGSDSLELGHVAAAVLTTSLGRRIARDQKLHPGKLWKQLTRPRKLRGGATRGQPDDVAILGGRVQRVLEQALRRVADGDVEALENAVAVEVLATFEQV